ncbi:MAG: hypothetical protein YYHSYBAR_002854 [Candidatus Fervidibacter sacchari]
MTTLELIFVTQRVISVNGDAEDCCGGSGVPHQRSANRNKGGARNGAEKSNEGGKEDDRQEEHCQEEH